MTSIINLQHFREVYALNLAKHYDEHPERFAWARELMPEILERVFLGIDNGTFNKDSESFKATCKELKIKHTYKAIAEYIRR